MRGVGIGGSERWWAGLREALARGTAEPEPAFAIVEADPRTETISALLTVVRRVVASENDVAPDLLAASADLRALAEWHVAKKTTPLALDVLAGWREPLIGKPLLRALAGELVIKVAEDAPSGVTLVSTR
jgi:ribonuclease D